MLAISQLCAAAAGLTASPRSDNVRASRGGLEVLLDCHRCLLLPCLPLQLQETRNAASLLQCWTASSLLTNR